MPKKSSNSEDKHDSSLDKAILDQIFEKLIISLRQNKNFDSPTIENIEGLIKSGEMKKAPQIIKAIKVVTGNQK